MDEGMIFVVVVLKAASESSAPSSSSWKLTLRSKLGFRREGFWSAHCECPELELELAPSMIYCELGNDDSDNCNLVSVCSKFTLAAQIVVRPLTQHLIPDKIKITITIR